MLTFCDCCICIYCLCIVKLKVVFVYKSVDELYHRTSLERPQIDENLTPHRVSRIHLLEFPYSAKNTVAPSLTSKVRQETQPGKNPPPLKLASRPRPERVAPARPRFNTISACNKPTRSTQPCIPPGSLNRVPATDGVRAGMSPLPGGR